MDSLSHHCRGDCRCGYFDAYERSREDCLNLMLSDIERYGSFVISGVTGDFGNEITSMYDLAVFVSAPLGVRIERIKQRAVRKHGGRVCGGGDMYEQHLNFVDFVASRSLAGVEGWANTLECPIIHVDGTRSISDNTEWIAEQYLRSKSNEKKGTVS
jgi:hypothetical protein